MRSSPSLPIARKHLILKMRSNVISSPRQCSDCCLPSAEAQPASIGLEEREAPGAEEGFLLLNEPDQHPKDSLVVLFNQKGRVLGGNSVGSSHPLLCGAFSEDHRPARGGGRSAFKIEASGPWQTRTTRIHVFHALNFLVSEQVSRPDDSAGEGYSGRVRVRLCGEVPAGGA